MAQPPQQEVSTGPGIAEAFIADRQVFWHRFTNFTTGAIIAIAALLILMWIFIA